YSFATSPAGLASSYATAGTTATGSLSFPDNGTFTVYGRIFDKDNGFTPYNQGITINNVAPTATFSAPASANEGASFNVSLTTPFDPSSTDTGAGFHYSFATSLAGLAASYGGQSGQAG